MFAGARTTTASFFKEPKFVQVSCWLPIRWHRTISSIRHLVPLPKNSSELADGHRPNSCWIFVRHHISEVSNSLSLWKSSTIHGKLELHVSLSWKERPWTKPSWSMTSVPKKRAQPGRDPMLSSLTNFVKSYFLGVFVFLWWTYPQHFKQHTCGRRGLF